MSWGHGEYGRRVEWDRTKTAKFDEEWHRLSVAARKAFVETIKLPTGATDPYSGVLVEQIGSEVASELEREKLIRIARITLKGGEVRNRAIIQDDGVAFARRLKTLAASKMLTSGSRPEQSAYRYAQDLLGHPIFERIKSVLRKGGYRTGEHSAMLTGFVVSSVWADLVQEAYPSKIAGRVFEEVEALEGSIAVPELIRRLTSRKIDEKAARAAIHDLVTDLVLFEDLDPETYEILVGLYGPVRNLRVNARVPKIRHARLSVVPASEITMEGPSGGIRINDIRSLLMEVLASPPKIRQDDQIFQKDLTRIEKSLVPWPKWLVQVLGETHETRVNRAHQTAMDIGLVAAVIEGSSRTLKVTPSGRDWLGLSANRQYETFYGEIRENSLPDLERRRLDPWSYSYSPPTDERFLGVSVAVESRPLGKNGRPANWQDYYNRADTESLRSYEPLRRRFAEEMERLPASGFVSLGDFLHDQRANPDLPLLVGNAINDVTVWIDGASRAQVDDILRPLWIQVLKDHILKRLVPMDAVRVAVTNDSDICIARTPMLPVYYGRGGLPEEPAVAAPLSVIVQPDFSVTVIGLDTAPAATLSVYCDRVQGHTGTGALTFRITRDSIRRAVAQGNLTGPAIVKSLESLVTKALPENIKTEILDWANWVRKVNAEHMMLFRCTDIDAASRVVAAFGKHAERISSNYVAVNIQKINAPERQKLLGQGIVVTKDRITFSKPEPPPVSPSETPKRGRAKATGVTKKATGRTKK